MYYLPQTWELINCTDHFKNVSLSKITRKYKFCFYKFISQSLFQHLTCYNKSTIAAAWNTFIMSSVLLFTAREIN